jgi:hypothetical protein
LNSFELDAPTPYSITHKLLQVGDLIVELNGQILAPGTHKDTFLELLTTAARPVVLGFKTAGTPEAPPAF